jgi:hypothetical protein
MEGKIMVLLIILPFMISQDAAAVIGATVVICCRAHWPAKCRFPFRRLLVLDPGWRLAGGCRKRAAR